MACSSGESEEFTAGAMTQRLLTRSNEGTTML
jgi:hypothetical protein